jgi:hypothetical protein
MSVVTSYDVPGGDGVADRRLGGVGDRTARPGQLPLSGQPSRSEVTVRAQDAALWWLGVHGGAGESTLAFLFAGTATCEHGWPVLPTRARTRVVLVARTNYLGMRAVQATMRDWNANRRSRIDVLGTVLIAARPGRLPKELAELRRDLVGATPHLWDVPWVEAWELGRQPEPSNSPKVIEEIRVDIATALRAAVEAER